nr:MAG TPA: Photosynthesis system II assembly factor YCF48 [Caudoviricetes sp.]
MATYTKSASFSYNNLNSGSNLNITGLTRNDIITNIKLTSSLKFHTGISNSVKFSIYDGTTKVNTSDFSVSYNNLDANTTSKDINRTLNAMDIAYGNGTYVIAVDNDQYYSYSTNGSSFTSKKLYTKLLTTDTIYPVRVMYGDNKFVIHSGFYSYYSSNGTSWTRVYMSGGLASWRAGPSVYGNGTFVATLNGNQYRFYSTNGTSWTRVSASSRTYTDGAYGGGNFVFITSDGTIDYSANGSSWSSTSIGNGSGWNGLVYDGTKFVAINTSGDIATSTNGTSWAYFANKLSAQNWKSIAYGNNMYIAIANNSNIIAVSFDASTWYEGTLGNISKSWNRITYCNNKFWALCSSSSTQITLDPSIIYSLSPNTTNTNITYKLNSTSLKLTTENLPNAFEGSMNVDLSMKQPENYTITQNYYIENSTTKLKASDTSTEVEGNSWSYPSFENTLTYNDEIYDQTTTSGDPESGTLNNDKSRNVYYKLRTHTITQHYYIENSTTKVKDDDIIVVSAGKSWSFPKYSDLIKINKVSYIYSYASGDPASGTNIDSNKERNIYYSRIESIESISLFAIPNSIFLSDLVNDKKFPHVNDIEFECGALSSDSITLCDSLTDKIFKIHISISSSATTSEIISLPLKIDNSVISTVYCDLMNGIAIENRDIELTSSQSLVLDLSSAADRLKAAKAIVKVKIFIEPIS